MFFEEFKETYPFIRNFTEKELIRIFEAYFPCVWVSNLKTKKLCLTRNFRDWFKYKNIEKNSYIKLQKINEYFGKYYKLNYKLEKIKGDFQND